MQNRIFFICIHLIVIVSFGQTKVLSNYKFEKGEYYLVGQRSESDYNSFADSLGNFYTDDIGLLNSIKKEWIFKKPTPKWSCGYHYTIHIVKNGKDLETFNINLNCNVIVCGDDYFYFESEKMEKFKEKFKKLYAERKTFAKISNARAYYQKIDSEQSHIFTVHPSWLNHEGTFKFDYTYQKNDVKDDTKLILKRLTNEVKKAYPSESFYLEDAGGSSAELFVRVICNKSLSDKFNLYKKAIYSQWKPFPLKITSFWKNNKTQ